MDAQQSIQVFTICRYVSIAVMLFGIAFAIFIFFKCKIPMVYALMTGKIRKKTVEEMQRSGILRSEEELEAESYTGGTKVKVNDISDFDYSTEPIKQYQSAGMGTSVRKSENPFTVIDHGPAVSMSQKLNETTILSQATETTVLSEAGETTILQEVAETTVLSEAGETTVLQVETETALLKEEADPETSLLKEDEDPETSVLKEATADPETMVLKQSTGGEAETMLLKEEEIVENAGATVRLNRDPNFADAEEDPETSVLNRKFVPVEHTLIIHTNEVI